ncbi:hypothetical protein SI65_09589 [Aspergillus cristatus]|uniref:Uncharacterized protein n=1 Tax=Aspergillus cristatus TaxID=573508 RepID=A0A1E3B2C1_ASPCR|nr:hypothetical protein SI65_09589 [Aspergillus cristatus]
MTSMENGIVVDSELTTSASDSGSDAAATSSSDSSEEKTTAAANNAATTMTATDSAASATSNSYRVITTAPPYEDLLAACRENRRADLETLISNRRANNNEVCRYTLSNLLKEAVLHDSADVVAFCLEQGAIVYEEPLLWTVFANDAFASYSVLIQHRAIDPNRVLPCYGDLLGVLIVENKLEGVRCCLENGANPNENLLEEYKTALAAAAERGNIAMVELLLDHGAWTKESGALILAAEKGDTEMVRFLLSKGLDINEMGVKGPLGAEELDEIGTALHKAISNGHINTAALLIDAGADTKLKDAQGRTPEKLAEECHQPAILEKLGKLPLSSHSPLSPSMPTPGSTESGSSLLGRISKAYEKITPTPFFISLVFFFCIYQSRKVYHP